MATDRSWSLEELRHALWLGYGGTSPDRLATSAIAEVVGVSSRTVQRWLTGASEPSPEHALALRLAIAPDPLILRRQAMDAEHAEAAARELDRARPRAASKQWRAQGWQHPHVLWTLHHETLGLVRAMVTRAQPAKATEIPAEWTLQDRTGYPNRPRAVMAKHAQLESATPWRVKVRPNLVDDGRHEVWLDTKPS